LHQVQFAPDAKRKVEWTYDHQGRKIRQTTYDGSSGSYVVSNDLQFVYDGWHCLAELENLSPQSSVLRTYTWGLDLSNSLDGAGGVGGLLLVNSAAAGVHFAAYDGNGNVVALVGSDTGQQTAFYEYSPFGETLRSTGSMAKENPYRFSTKPTEDTMQFIPYEFRAYRPDIGRWLSREPLDELAFFRSYVSPQTLEESEMFEAERLRYGINTYLFVDNIPTQYLDRDGARKTPYDGDVQVTAQNRRSPPKGMELVKVEKCHILLIYGHNYASTFFVGNKKKEGVQWIWNIVPKDDNQPKDSAYAAVIACNAHLVPNEIPLPGYTPVDKIIPVKDPSADTDLSREAGKVNKAAEAAAKDICKRKDQCGCKKVYIDVKPYGLSTWEKWSYPAPYKKTIKCKGVN
jgi:RHS repeat-associated protein